MTDITIDLSPTPLILVTSIDGSYVGFGSGEGNTNSIRILIERALTADNGVKQGAKAASWDYPIYLEVPDSRFQRAPELGTRGRVNVGAISPDNPYYAELSKAVHMEFPKEVITPPGIDEAKLPSTLTADPLYPKAKEALLHSIAYSQQEATHSGIDGARSMLYLQAVKEDPAQFVRMYLERARKEQEQKR